MEVCPLFCSEFYKDMLTISKNSVPKCSAGMVFEPPMPVGMVTCPFVCILILGEHVATFYVFLHSHDGTFIIVLL